MGSFLSDTFFKSFMNTENMLISIFMITKYCIILPTAEFLMILAETASWEIERK
jgi:hypothetical protein